MYASFFPHPLYYYWYEMGMFKESEAVLHMASGLGRHSRSLRKKYSMSFSRYKLGVVGGAGFSTKGFKWGSLVF